MGNYKVLFHLDEGVNAKVEMVFHNINNLLEDLRKENVNIELVANGESVNNFVKELGWHKAKINGLMSKGVHFVVCANSLCHAGLTKDSLIDNIEVVSSGVSELVKKQSEGRSYIRP